MFKKREETGQSSLHPLPSFRPVRPSSPAPLFSFLGQAQPAPSFLFPSLSPADRLGPPVTFISPNRPPAPPLGSETAGHPRSDVRSPLLSLPRASVSSGAQCAQALPSPFPPSPLLPLAARIDRRRRAAATLRTKSVVPSRPCPASRCGEHRLLPRFLSVLLPCRFVVPRAPTACFGGPSMAPPRSGAQALPRPCKGRERVPLVLLSPLVLSEW